MLGQTSFFDSAQGYVEGVIGQFFAAGATLQQLASNPTVGPQAQAMWQDHKSLENQVVQLLQQYQSGGYSSVILSGTSTTASLLAHINGVNSLAAQAGQPGVTSSGIADQTTLVVGVVGAVFAIIGYIAWKRK